MGIKRIILRSILFMVSLPLLCLFFIYINYHIISYIASDKIYTNTQSIPFREYALVLGAGNYEPDKWVNHAFDHRMAATYLLYTKKKFDKIIVSGISVPGVFSEPEEMKDVLIEYGMPPSSVMMDSAGVRTWVSVERSKEIFKVNQILIISQKGQLERALFSAACMGIDAIGFVAEPFPQHHRHWIEREYLARVKCIADCITHHFKIS